MLEVANYYDRLGWAAIPVELPRFGDKNSGKTALCKWKLYMLGRPSESERRTLFQIESNIGIVTGRVSDLIFADLDSEDAKQEWLKLGAETPLKFSTGRGEQWGYKHPGIDVATRIRLKKIALDIKAEGAYSVVPPSTHFSGKKYTWQTKPTKALVEDTPVFPVKVLEEERTLPESRIEQVLGQTRLKLIERAILYAAKVDPAVAGQNGHGTLYRFVCKMLKPEPKGFGLSVAEASAIITQFNLRAEPPFSEKELEHKILSVLKSLGE